MAALCLCGAVSCSRSSSSSDSDSAPDSVLGERITPDEDDEEFELGEYYVSPNGIKLYFEPEEFPEELVILMEKYFTSYAKNDYDSYTECLYPSYITEMNKFLEGEHGYKLDTAFRNQCDSLRDNMGGDYDITRIKLESYDVDLGEFFDYSSECFGKDYYAEVSGEVDKLYPMMFFIMAKGAEEDHEDLLIKEYEIVFAEKDGRFYTFG